MLISCAEADSFQEQVEEEDTVSEINDKVKAMSKMQGLYYHIDHELGHRKKD